MSSRSPFVGELLRAVERLRIFVETPALWRVDRLGQSPRFIGKPHIESRGVLEIGDDFVYRSLPVQSHLVVHTGASLRIGHRVSFGAGSGVACHSTIIIGDDTQIGAFSMLLDSDYHVPGNPAALPVPLPISIGRGVRIGSHVTVLRGTTIGDGAVVEAGSVVSGTVAAGARVSGVPARQVVASSAPAAGGPGLTIEERIAAVAMRTFRLSSAPDLAHGPQQIARWDSLGALSFLVGLEEEFGVTLGEQEALGVQRLADIVPLVTRKASIAA